MMFKDQLCQKGEENCQGFSNVEAISTFWANTIYADWTSSVSQYLVYIDRFRNTFVMLSEKEVLWN